MTTTKPVPLPGGLTLLDKSALITLAAGVAFKLLLHNVGATLATSAWWFDPLRWFFGLVAFVAFDLVVVAVIVDARANGADVRSYVALGGATIAAASIGLDVAGVGHWPELQAAQALLMLLFGIHLMRPRMFDAMRAALDTAVRDLEQARSDLEQARARIDQERSTSARDLDQARTAAGHALDQAQTEIAQLRTALEQRPIPVAHPALTDGQDALIMVNGRSYSVRRLAAAFEVAPSTAAKKLLAIEPEGGE